MPEYIDETCQKETIGNDCRCRKCIEERAAKEEFLADINNDR